MRPVLAALALLTAAPAAGAQPLSVAATSVARPYDPAPWWMREPIIASLGEVRAELPANRANLSAAFESIDRSAPEATAQSAAKVRPLAQALLALGRDKVRVELSFSTRPLYAQYRDKEGNVQENQRSDKVERYAVTANVQVEVRDVSLVERAYALLVAARPTSTQRAYFRLQPDNATQTELFRLAVADARRRATEATEASGARLGAVKLIDPTGRACQTDVLVAGAPRSYGGSGDVQEVVVTGSRRMAMDAPAAPPPPPPPPPPAPSEAAAIEAAADALKLPLQPPLSTLTRQACVIYGIGGG